jgi:hypothetical protein
MEQFRVVRRRSGWWRSLVVAMAMLGEGAVVLLAQQVRRDALYCCTSSCNNESKHIESRNNREYSEKEKANSTEWTSALKINIAFAEREDLEGIVAFPGEKEKGKSTASGRALSK